MKTATWWRGICISGLIMACAGFGAGCEDDNNDDSASATDIVNTNATDVIHQPDTEPDETADPVPEVTTQVLFDKSRRILGETSFTVLTDATPGAGTVTIEASWTTTDNLAANAPIDIPLEFIVNEGVAGAGNFHNAGHKSPFSSAVVMPANTACKIQVKNNVNDCISEIHLKATYSSD